MENTVKVKKRDALKPFSIVAGVLMILLALSIVFTNTATFLVQYYATDDSGAAEDSVENSEESAGNKNESSVKNSDVINVVLSYSGSIITVLLLISAAIILFVNKNVSGIYIPMGLLTYTAISPLLNNVSTVIVNRFLAEMLGPDSFYIGGIYVMNIVTAIGTLISLVIAAIPALLFFIASCTFMKKVKAIPMFIIFGALVLGTVGSTLLALIGFLNNILNLPGYSELFMYLYEEGGIALVLVKVFQMYISPLLVGVNGIVMCLATLLAAIGMCSKPKLVATADVIEIGETAAPAAETAEPAPEAEKSNGDEPEHDFTKGM